MAARGDSLCNPLNLDATADRWLGEIEPSHDKRLSEFETPFFGIRAGAKVLLNGARKGRVSVYAIISRFSPKSENPTAAYIDFVCKALAVEPHTRLDLRDQDVLCELLTSMIHFEQGDVIHPDKTIEAAAKAALLATA